MHDDIVEAVAIDVTKSEATVVIDGNRRLRFRHEVLVLDSTELRDIDKEPRAKGGDRMGLALVGLVVILITRNCSTLRPSTSKADCQHYQDQVRSIHAPHPRGLAETGRAQIGLPKLMLDQFGNWGMTSSFAHFAADAQCL